MNSPLWYVMPSNMAMYTDMGIYTDALLYTFLIFSPKGRIFQAISAEYLSKEH